jgi:50S ribosomal protein L16 3-hydroxylase
MPQAAVFDLDELFWKRFVEGGSMSRPALIKTNGNFRALTDSEVLGILRDATQASTSKRRYVLIHTRQNEIKSDYSAFLPNEDDGSLPRYAERLMTLCDDVQVFSSASQRFSWAAYEAARLLLLPLFQHYGLPEGGAGTDMFLGRYATTAVGIHRETVSVFSFINSGRKRYLFWPEEHFEGEYDSTGYAPLGTSDYAPHLSSATVIDAGPGDIVYWPAGEWHIAVSEEWSVSFNINLHMKRGANDRLIELMRGLMHQSNVSEQHHELPEDDFLTDLPPLTRKALHDLEQLVNGGDLRRLLMERWLQKLSAFGIDMPPPRSRTGLDSSEVFAADSRFPVRAARDADRLLVASNGHVACVPWDPRLAAAISIVNDGSSLTVTDLAARTRLKDESEVTLLTDLVRFLKSTGSARSPMLQEA